MAKLKRERNIGNNTHNELNTEKSFAFFGVFFIKLGVNVEFLI